MVRTAATLRQAVRRYNLLSRIYGLNASLGASTSAEAIEGAVLHAGDRVLELGVGTGRDMLHLARRVGPEGRVLGIDLAAGMLERTRRRVETAGYRLRAPLLRGDARHIPLADKTVDVVFSSRLLDLVDTPEIPTILAECRRVLKPSGQVVLVHMSKPGPERTLFERLYASAAGFGGLLFLSRPVLAAELLAQSGFPQVTRVYRRGFPIGTEIVWGRKPA